MVNIARDHAELEKILFRTPVNRRNAIDVAEGDIWRSESAQCRYICMLAGLWVILQLAACGTHGGENLRLEHSSSTPVIHRMANPLGGVFKSPVVKILSPAPSIKGYRPPPTITNRTR